MDERTVGDLGADGKVWSGTDWLTPEQWVEGTERLMRDVMEYGRWHEGVIDKMMAVLYPGKPYTMAERERAEQAMEVAHEALYDRMDKEQQQEQARERMRAMKVRIAQAESIDRAGGGG